MYLFSTRQSEIISKMNELYIFSHEANNLVECVKKALGISSSCPIYTVTKRLTETGNISQSERSERNYQLSNLAN